MIKYGYLKNTIFLGTEKVEAGTWVKFDDEDSAIDVFRKQGVFNAPNEEPGGKDTYQLVPNEIVRDDEPAPIGDADVVKIYDSTLVVEEGQPNKNRLSIKKKEKK